MSSKNNVNSVCFICGLNITDFDNDHAPANLKGLLVKICQLLKLSEIQASEWDFLTGIQQQYHICCGNCLGLLKNVERVHEIILRTRRELKKYLDRVETLVIKSESQSIQSAGWTESYFKFRRHIVERTVIPTLVESSPQDCVKEEVDSSRLNDEDDGHLLDDDTFHHNNWNNYVETNTKDNTQVNNTTNDTVCKTDNVVLNPVITLSFTPPTETHPLCHLSLMCSKFDEIPSTSVTITNYNKQDAPPPFKRRKIVVIAEEDEEENVKVTRRSSGRTAKQNAENVLKCYILDQSDEEERPTRNDNTIDQDYSGNGASNTSAEENAVSSCDNHDDDEYSNDSVSKRKKKLIRSKCRKDPDISNVSSQKSKKYKKKGIGQGKWTCPKINWLPFIVADENLYLFKYSTFILKTYTHIHCLAHQCSFHTEFDYYSSFQIMRQHLEEKHRTRKHRQTPHPCRMCNILFPNQFKLREHFKAVHNDKLHHSVAKGVCECCLRYTRNMHARFHAFTHKSEEEKAYARQIGDGNKRCFKPKEREISEKNFVCVWENCNAAFKTYRNLKRHKETHVPTEERSDMSICPDCGERIVSEGLAKHIARRHHPELASRTLVCPICDKRFLSGDNSKFQQHIRQHRGEKTFMCTQCAAVFSSIALLNGHVKQVHEIYELPCEWCDKVYTKKASLVGHMRRRHPDKFKANLSFKFMSKFYYNEELERNRKENFIGPIQKYPCPLCDKACKYRHSLKRHMLTHTDKEGGRKKRTGGNSRNQSLFPEHVAQQVDSSDSEEEELGKGTSEGLTIDPIGNIPAHSSGTICFPNPHAWRQ